MTSTVLTGGHIFDGTGTDPFPADIRYEDGQITDIGAELSADERVDVAGHTIIPGLIDCHVHAIMSSTDPLYQRQEPFSYQFLAARAHLEKTLRAGFTTVRDAGGADLGIKRAVEDGLIDGPDIYISIAMLSQTGGHSDYWSVNGACHEAFIPHPGRPSGIVDGIDQMRLRVRELLRAGADVIKVCSSGGVLSTRDDPRHPQFSMQELRVCVEEAAKNDVAVMAHAQGAPGILNALRAGVRSIEHGIYADNECFDLMRETGAWLVPTMTAPLAVIAASDKGAPLSDDVVEKARSVVSVHSAMLKQAAARNVNIAFGTDSGVVPHGDNAHELHQMHLAGMTAPHVLQSATSSAADLLGLSDRGSIAIGRRADLVVLSGELYDLKTFRDRITTVIKNGRTIDRTPRAAVL